jgi:uncharacterized protein DUF362
MMKKEKGKISRRSFLKTSTAGAVGLSLGGLVFTPRQSFGYVGQDQINPNIDNTRVVCAYDPAMTTGTDPTNTWADQNPKTVDSTVSANIDAMARSLAEEGDTNTAWNTIFIKPPAKNWNEIIVAIKTNNIAEQHTRNAVMKKFCEVLVNELGVAAANIHIYDGRHGSSPPISTSTPFYDLPPGVCTEDNWGGITTSISVPPPSTYTTTNCVLNIANGTADIIINIAMCKGHSDGHGRFTMCMKNHFGTCTPRCGNTDYLVGINKSEAILGAMDSGSGLIIQPRQQLCFIDALWASQGGPSGYPSDRPNSFFMGTFAPALDYVVATKFRRDTMSWSIHEANTLRFLTDFGYTTGDLTNSGEMIDALTWTAVRDWRRL